MQDDQFESSLKSLLPATAMLDPIHEAFEAGKRSQVFRLRAWRAAAVVMLAVGLIGWMVPNRPHEIARQAIVSEAANFQPIPQQSVLMLQRAVQEKGIDGLPPTYLPGERAVRSRDSL